MSRTSGLLTAGTLALAATFSIGVAHTVNAATTKPTPKACALLTPADFTKAGLAKKVGPPEDYPRGALSPGGSACRWNVSTAKADVRIELSVELSYGRSPKRIPGAWFSVDRYEPIKDLPSGSCYVEGVYFDGVGGATGGSHNWIVVKQGPLVVTLKATVEVVPKKSMLLLAKTIDARVT